VHSCPVIYEKIQLIELYTLGLTEAAVARIINVTTVWGCLCVALWVFLIIYFTVQYSIDRREEETSYIVGYANMAFITTKSEPMMINAWL
jgi:hypothetical protein